MKFNPYAALLMTGALMLLTVVIAQTGPNSALLKAGAVSVDRDVSSFAARTLTSLEGGRQTADEDHDSPTRVAVIDRQPKQGLSNY
jgi:D-serine deaminase-like pyridoxal phosphate-dependent protein